MPSYNYYAQAEAGWLERFPSWAFGYREWVNQPPLNDWSGPSIYDWFPETPEPPLSPVARMPCPRLFVSHRMFDAQAALRIAWLARQEGWDYWIDVLDPSLEALRRKERLATLSAEQETLAIAAIVEFALLNCSHLLAVMTEKTRGTMWVPYEYGRVKDPAPLTVQVSSWMHPQLEPKDWPEYLVLGKVHLNEDEIVGWLRWEMERWRQRSSRCPQRANAGWDGDEPPRLPGDAGSENQTGERFPGLNAPGGEVRWERGGVLVGGVRLPMRGRPAHDETPRSTRSD